LRGLRVQLALVVILAAIVGALLHPAALLLSIVPFDTRGLIRFLEEVRSVIADLLGWGVLSLIALMAFFVIRGRAARPSKSPVQESAPDPGSPPRAVVAITAYNDALATAQAVRDFLRQPSVAKVLVIDNNSTDDTAKLAAASGAQVIQEPRQGYGFACIRGLTEARKVPYADVVILTEGDGTFFADDLPKFLAYIDHSDLVVGNRVVRGLVDSDSQMDYFFTWGNMAVAMLLRLKFWDGRHLGPAGLMDVGCTYRAIRSEALERILPDLDVGGNHFSPHMLLVAMARDLSVVEIPVRFRRRVGLSKGASQSLAKGFWVGLTMIWHIITFSLRPTPQSRLPRTKTAADVVAANGSGTEAHELTGRHDANTKAPAEISQ
jgi:cellulose synthase/poly-beta-1,6-N-acetylglucosamine synthase-like glycosyltransferase